MSDQSEARNKIRNELGSTVAEKASDAVVALYAAAAAAPFGLESMAAAGPAPRVPTVLEMPPRAPVKGLESVAKDALRAAQKAAAEVFRQFGEENAALCALSALRRSSRGPFRNAAGQEVKRPHLVAPGGTPQDSMTSCLVTGGFGACGHGTSFAAPHVTGLIALLLSLDPEQGPDEIRQALVATCTPLAGFTENDQGRGFLKL